MKVLQKTVRLYRPLAAVLILAACLSATAQANTERPNVLFISIDDLNDFPAYMGRYPDAKTPNLDRLARQGTAFQEEGIARGFRDLTRQIQSGEFLLEP